MGVVNGLCRVGGYQRKTRFQIDSGYKSLRMGVILTMIEQGYGHSVAKERVKAQGCDPMGIIEGPCGYSTPLVGTLGKLFFWETSGESVPVGPRINVFGACDSACMPKTIKLCHASRAPGLRFCRDPKGVVECALGHANRGLGIRVKLFPLGFLSSWGH